MTRKKNTGSKRVKQCYDRHKANGFRRLPVLVHDEDRDELKEAGQKLRDARGYPPGE